jgi:hypothetical protein
MKQIKSKREYERTLDRIEGLFNSWEMLNEDSRLEGHMLISIVEDYERQNFPALPFTSCRNMFGQRIFGVSLLKTVPLGILIGIAVYLAVTEGSAALLAFVIAAIFVVVASTLLTLREESQYIREDICMLNQMRNFFRSEAETEK